jgi:uncharacterized damage-inducible protein DinB
MNWNERTFVFGRTSEEFVPLLNRLSSTHERIADLVKNAPDDVLSVKPGGKWSVKEHVGHLLVMESLWIARLDDLVMGRETMRPWNGTNSDTDDANFNLQHMNKILSEFNMVRSALVDYVSTLENDATRLSAWHERLRSRLTLADHLWFVAEHDDHHLSKIQSLLSA